MALQERQQIINELQAIRGTKIVTHILSDRRIPIGLPGVPAIATKMGTEAQPFFYKSLRKLGRNPRLDLYLYTTGGQTDSVWPMVSLFWEFSDEFIVIVPYKAHSAGTLVCLGAKTIVMGEAAELSPVDPKTGNQFNPVDDIDKKTRRAISVEEVTSYFDLAKDPSKSFNNNEPGPYAVENKLAFELLAQQVHPLALGNVNRSHKQIRELARRLLSLHIDVTHDENKKRIAKIVNELTQGRYSHTDILNRKEAKELIGDDIVTYASDNEQELIWKLFEEYENTLSLLKPFIINSEIGDTQKQELEIIGAFIETENSSYIYRSKCNVTQRTELPQQFQVKIQPGQPMPLIPGFPKHVNIEQTELGWVNNEKGV